MQFCHYLDSPFAASHSRVTKSPCWLESKGSNTLGQDRQEAHII